VDRQASGVAAIASKLGSYVGWGAVDEPVRSVKAAKVGIARPARGLNIAIIGVSRNGLGAL
jgi:hypothetical protein